MFHLPVFEQALRAHIGTIHAFTATTDISTLKFAFSSHGLGPRSHAPGLGERSPLLKGGQWGQNTEVRIVDSDLNPTFCTIPVPSSSFCIILQCAALLA